MNRPFTAKRRRRCTWPGCPHGGVIRPGDQAVRLSNHVYMHAADSVALTEVFARLARDLPVVMANIMRAFTDMAEAIAAAFSETRARWVEATLFGGGDRMAYDLRPDCCWRCDAAPGVTELGLCKPCAIDLGAMA